MDREFQNVWRKWVFISKWKCVPRCPCAASWQICHADLSRLLFSAISLVPWVPFGEVCDDFGFCRSSGFSWASCFQESGTIVDAASQFTEGHQVKSLYKLSVNWSYTKVIFSDSNTKCVGLCSSGFTCGTPQRLSAGPALKMPEPLTISAQTSQSPHCQMNSFDIHRKALYKI